jgi:NAD(P)-dependent dehydrogenase (short-subunit alcohol dehydrogenase family)
MSNLLENQTAVITGAASGNGRGISMRVAEEGADVVVADIQEEPRLAGRPTHEKVRNETDRDAKFVECDVTDPEMIADAVDTADEFGGIDIMVNNAGIVLDPANIVDTDMEDYHRLIEINLDGVYAGTKLAAQRMIEQGEGGSIVNLSSTGGINGQEQSTPYSAAKGGVRVFTFAAAADLGEHGIRVNAIVPGVIETAMTKEDWQYIGSEMGEKRKQEEIPLQKFGTPEDIGDTVVYLSSDLAGHVTAESLLVDGGITNTQ